MIPQAAKQALLDTGGSSPALSNANRAVAIDYEGFAVNDSRTTGTGFKLHLRAIANFAE